jgi:hypothetical protein
MECGLEDDGWIDERLAVGIAVRRAGNGSPEPRQVGILRRKPLAATSEEYRGWLPRQVRSLESF